MTPPAPPTIVNPWHVLRRLTPARIALGRSGVSLPTEAHLAFQLAHAQARDAVHVELDVEMLRQALASAVAGAGVGLCGDADDGCDASEGSGGAQGGAGSGSGSISQNNRINESGGTGVTSDKVDTGDSGILLLESAAGDRLRYLQRPDLGRQLGTTSRALLRARAPTGTHDLALVIADGLSPQAVQLQAPLLLAALLPMLAKDGWQLAPLTIVRQARVAIGDEIATLLRARMVVVLIGERPGLSSPDSMGLYLTWNPEVGMQDAGRNCISNVRQAGLAPAEAAWRLHHLLRQARLLQRSGVNLKEDAPEAPAAVQAGANFLLPPLA